MLPALYDRLGGVSISEPLVGVADLADRIGAAPVRPDATPRPDPPILLDVRWTLGGGGGYAEYAAGHLPGAVFLDLDRDLCGPPGGPAGGLSGPAGGPAGGPSGGGSPGGSGGGGRHPLPDPAVLQEALRRAGVRADRPVVVYEAGGGVPVGSAARAWWTLCWAGHSDVRVLDGGYAAWVAAGGPVTTEVPEPTRGDFTVHPGQLSTVDAAAVPAVAAGGVLIDARIGPRYRGEVEPIDPVAGHIPGAVNQPVAGTAAADGRLLPAGRLRERFQALGVRSDAPVAAYCGSGVTAAQTVLALTVAGFRPALYVGSWSDWITDPTRPTATGAPS
jgi:thiosulfate/3-mercaptopyruvate sulfurtransferase